MRHREIYEDIHRQHVEDFYNSVKAKESLENSVNMFMKKTGLPVFSTFFTSENNNGTVLFDFLSNFEIIEPGTNPDASHFFKIVNRNTYSA